MNEQMRPAEFELEARAASSHDLLSDTEKSVVRKLLSEAESKAKSMREDISRLQTVISNLQRRYAIGLTRIKRLRAGLAPHKKIPPEILTRIFVYTLDKRALSLPPHSGVPIWSIMWVCSRWRQIAIAEPIIWSEIRAMGLGDLHALNPLLHDIFANRGRGGLISYHFSCLANARAWQDFLSLLSAYPSHLKHIDITFRDFIPPLVQAPPVKLDRLESINISFRRWSAYNRDITPAVDFFTSETLRKVLLSGYGAPPPSGWLNRVLLPWAQLTDLTIESIPFSAMEIILGQCVYLSRCAIQLEGNLEEQNVSLHPIQLTHLQSLLFCNPSDFLSTEYLLDLLTSPALTYLSFEHQNWKKWPHQSVLNLVSRSACSLEVLMTPELSVEEWEIVPTMRVMPGLTELHIYTKMCIADPTINTIRMEGLAPKLRILHGLAVFSLLPFMGLLESRCTGEEGVERRGIREASVTLREGHPDIYEGDYKGALLRLKECGVDLEISAI